jgi:hypothetical protein
VPAMSSQGTSRGFDQLAAERVSRCILDAVWLPGLPTYSSEVGQVAYLGITEGSDPNDYCSACQRPSRISRRPARRWRWRAIPRWLGLTVSSKCFAR